MHNRHPELTASRGVVNSRAMGAVRLARRHWRMALGAYVTMVLAGTMMYATCVNLRPFSVTKRSWGGFEERPTTAKCYQQERTAMILSFLLGLFGVDQFYAHHWPLAVFKLLTLGGGGIWWVVDDILWIVGGVYGTPGCPGGSKHGWQY